MQKIINHWSLAIGLLLLAVKPAIALTPTVSIQKLTSYITTNNFKLSCSAIGATSAQFSFKKDGGSYSDFGSSIDLSTSPCQVQVTSAQISDQTSYFFKVTLNSGETDETTTFYDISGPSGVSGYYKEQTGTGKYKLHWKNPGDGDFSKVIIYRGETSDFSADNSHEIAQVSGGASSDMTYDETQPDPNKTYYYALRAVDKAGNSSSLVGDSGTTTSTTSVLGASSSPTSKKVTQLPKEGSVLGSESSPSSSPEATTKNEDANSNVSEAANAISKNKKMYIGVGVLLLLGAAYLTFRKK